MARAIQACDTQASRHMDSVFLPKVQFEPFDRGPQPPRQPERSGCSGPRHHDCEFLAAVSRREIGSPDGLANRAGRSPQDKISSGVSVAIVDPLEAV